MYEWGEFRAAYKKNWINQIAFCLPNSTSQSGNENEQCERNAKYCRKDKRFGVQGQY
jgi:hypothetical protein